MNLLLFVFLTTKDWRVRIKDIEIRIVKKINMSQLKSEPKGLEVLENLYLVDKVSGKPMVNLQIVETNESRKDSGKKPMTSKFKVISPRESFFSPELSGTVVYGSVEADQTIEVDTELQGDIFVNKITLLTKNDAS